MTRTEEAGAWMATMRMLGAGMLPLVSGRRLYAMAFCPVRWYAVASNERSEVVAAFLRREAARLDT